MLSASQFEMHQRKQKGGEGDVLVLVAKEPPHSVRSGFDRNYGCGVDGVFDCAG